MADWLAVGGDRYVNLANVVEGKIVRSEEERPLPRLMEDVVGIRKMPVSFLELKYLDGTTERFESSSVRRAFVDKASGRAERGTFGRRRGDDPPDSMGVPARVS